MKFAIASRGQEITFIIRLLTIFGVVELRQMRALFDHLSKSSYGQILTRLRREGLAYFSPDGLFLTTNRHSLDRRKMHESIMTFWVFIKMRDNVQEFCASEPPAIMSFASASKDYDLIPGSPENIPIINATRSTIPKESVRLIAVEDIRILDEIIPREDNDYGILIGADGVQEIYKI